MHNPSSRARRRILFIAAAAAALTLHVTARAEVELDPATTTLNITAVGLNTAAVGITEKDKTARPKPQPPSSLRCWQYGRLLFEENNIEADSDTLAKAHTWKQRNPAGSSLHLLQLNDTLCLYKSSDSGVRSK